ncbi:MAG: hypothetical protein WC450_11880, partial [Candidatus Omnitrophota bacterium]
MFITHFEKQRSTFSYRLLSAFIAVMFIVSSVVPPTPVYAQLFPQGLANMPLPGAMVPLSPGFTPSLVFGLTVHPENPLEFDFIIGSGDNRLEGQAFQEESTRLIKYFLAALTVPEEEMWVNLSPYEKDRIIPENFGTTEMGRDLLAQDYILKQLTASLMYPEKDLGDQFWTKVRAKAQEKFGTTEIPMNTFNKVWIVPESASIYEHGQSVFVIASHLKVMLEEDYLALQENKGVSKYGLDSIHSSDADIVSGVSSEVVREMLIPEIEKEVNQGETFANLRQIYNSMILAVWYKQNLQGSLLGQVYVNQNKTKGVDIADKQDNQKIYDQYVEAFKKGVYNYIKEDVDQATNKVIPRKYFSGGIQATNLKIGNDVIKKVTGSSPIVQGFLAQDYNEQKVRVSLVEIASGKNANEVVTIAKNSSTISGSLAAEEEDAKELSAEEAAEQREQEHYNTLFQILDYQDQHEKSNNDMISSPVRDQKEVSGIDLLLEKGARYIGYVEHSYKNYEFYELPTRHIFERRGDSGPFYTDVYRFVDGGALGAAEKILQHIHKQIGVTISFEQWKNTLINGAPTQAMYSYSSLSDLRNIYAFQIKENGDWFVVGWYGDMETVEDIAVVNVNA